MTKTLVSKKSSTFQRRIAYALAVLGAIAALQGAFALWAVGEAERFVVKGRVAADIKLGFIELSLNKQRLRNWVAQHQFDAGADEQQRDALLDRMKEILAHLKALAEQIKTLDDSPAGRARQAQRHEALLVLDATLLQLERGLARLNPAPSGTNMTAAWQTANEIFDRAEGNDLKQLLSDSQVREDEALREKRTATDHALMQLRRLWIVSTVALVLAALIMAMRFTRALRRPILNLTEGASAIRAGQLSHRIPSEGTDEFGQVAESINAMAEELADHRQRESDARHVLEEQVASRTAELRTALDAQREMEARRRQLFADVSHELRTPTTAIRGEAQVALRGGNKPIEEYKSSLRRIEDVSQQLALSIDDLLTMARSDIDSMSLQRGTIDLADVLDDAFSNGLAMARAAAVNLVHDAWPENLMMNGDADRLRQLLLTLIDNAIRYSRNGETVGIEVRRLDQGGPRVEVRISDQGIGIPQEDISKVFTRGHRASNAIKHRRDGSGLGLSIARALALGHGGDIFITSEVNRGTVATVNLPLTASLTTGAVA